MKYAVAYRTESDNWIFLKFEPSRNLPYGMFGCGMKMFDDWESANAARIEIVVRRHSDEVEWPFVPEARMDSWAQSLRVVEVPDEAIAKFEEARRQTIECCDNPTANVPEGSRENQLFHRGREIGEIGKQGWSLLMAHLTRTSM